MQKTEMHLWIGMCLNDKAYTLYEVEEHDGVFLYLLVRKENGKEYVSWQVWNEERRIFSAIGRNAMNSAYAEYRKAAGLTFVDQPDRFPPDCVTRGDSIEKHAEAAADPVVHR